MFRLGMQRRPACSSNTGEKGRHRSEANGHPKRTQYPKSCPSEKALEQDLRPGLNVRSYVSLTSEDSKREDEACQSNCGELG